MRLRPSILFSLLAAAPPIAAQTPAESTGWHLGGGLDAVRFGHIAVSEAAPGVAAEVRPSGRPAVQLSAGRTYGAWGIGLEIGWAGGHIEAGKRRDLHSGSDVRRHPLPARRLASPGRSRPPGAGSSR